MTAEKAPMVSNELKRGKVLHQKQWWEEDDDKIHSVLIPLSRELERNQESRRVFLMEWRRLFDGISSMNTATKINYRSKRVNFNVVRSCITTASAKIAKNKPRPLCLSSGGDWTLEDKAKKLTKYAAGVFADTRCYAKAQLAFRDACLADIGAMRWYIEGEKIHCERVMPEELFVDPTDARYGNPQQLHQRRQVGRYKLAALFPNYADEIMLAPTSDRRETNSRIAGDTVDVWESWHLPSSEDACDGKHVICCSGVTLHAEEWEHESFPFAFIWWELPVDGFFSPGLAEELRGIQGEITELLARIQDGHRLIAVPRMFVPEGSVNKSELTSEVGGIVTFTGPQAPTAVASQAFGGEVYQHLERLYQKAYEVTGISSMSARAQKPAGLDSGAALREFSDIESERFALVQQRWEDFFLTSFRIVMTLAKQMYADGIDLPIRSRSRKFIETIRWSDVDMNDDEFDLSVFPTSMLPQTPAGRLQTVSELIKSGLIPKEHALALLDYPDLEEFTSLQTAALDDARMLVDSMLEGGDYTPPEPFMNLQLCRQIAQSAYLRAKTKNVDEDRLDMLRTFISDCTDMLTPPEPTPIPGPPAGPMPGPMPPDAMGPPTGPPMQ